LAQNNLFVLKVMLNTNQRTNCRRKLYELCLVSCELRLRGNVMQVAVNLLIIISVHCSGSLTFIACWVKLSKGAH